MEDVKRTARLTGLLYLIWVISGVYGVFILPKHTMVPGNAAATADKILANEFLFRTGIINDIISGTMWVLIAMLLYRLFREVNGRQARLLVALVIVQVPVLFFTEALNAASLMIFKGELLKSFAVAQRQDLAMLFFKIGDYSSMVQETFWGLWLLPFGRLVYKSMFIPRILGVFLILNGIAYIIPSFASILFPGSTAAINKFAFPFWILGEISIMLWLLIKGANTAQPEAA